MHCSENEKMHMYKYDTMRFLLLFLVIIGHSMEQYAGQWVTVVYCIIYSFHMPAFLYLVGKFARFNRRKIFRRLIVTYFVFQTVFIMFAKYILCDEAIILQYTTPYWILWFLLTMIVYYILLPLLPEKGTKESKILFWVSICIALAAGYEKTIGSHMSLSRTIVFFPFFLGGYYSSPKLPMFDKKGIKICGIAASIIFIVAGEKYILDTKVPVGLLYGSVGYEICGSNLQARLVVMLTAAAWIILLETFLPEKKIPILSVLGQNTMPVFLAHAFIMRLALKYHWFRFSQGQNLALACVVAFVIIILFGNCYVGKGFKRIFS